MAITFDLPGDIEQNLRRSMGDLERAAKEAALVELYRQGRLSHRDFCRALGLSRMEAEEVLKQHFVHEDLMSTAEYESSLARLRAEADE
jgi:hypothetical protein